MHDLRLARDRLDRAYVRTLVAAGHEISHLAQFESKDPEMALCSVAQAGNQFNYKLNRFQNRRGIMAELNAIHFAGLHMERLYPHVDRDEMLCQYVHDQIYGDQDDTRNIIRPYYIDWPEGGFKSVRDIFSAFDKAYDSAAHHVNGYSCRIPGKANDAYAKLTGLGFCRRVNPEWNFLRFALEHAKSAHDPGPETLPVQPCASAPPFLDCEQAFVQILKQIRRQAHRARFGRIRLECSDPEAQRRRPLVQYQDKHTQMPLSLKNLTRFDFSREKMAAFNAAWAAREQAYKDN